MDGKKIREQKGIAQFTRKLAEVLVTGPVTPNVDLERGRKHARNGFFAVLIYAVAYGFYEYFIVYTYGFFDGQGKLMGRVIFGIVMTAWHNWAFMFSGCMLVILLSTRFNFEALVMGVFAMFMVEDLTYWLCKWMDEGVYPFPAGNWWDSYFGSFEALGGLGWSVPFWPEVPFFYFPGFASIIVYYIAVLQKPKYGRVISWIAGPIFIAIIAGTPFSADDAGVVLVIVPVIIYSYGAVLLWLKKRRLSRDRVD
ncbi:MAG: hypothetical protein ACTSUE_00415 [Promethearchaeota archaeon]